MFARKLGLAVIGMALSAFGLQAGGGSKDKDTPREKKVPKDAIAGKPLKARTTLKGHTQPVYLIGFSKDGRRLVSAAGAEVKVWDLAKERELFSSVQFSSARDFRYTGGVKESTPDGQLQADSFGDGVWLQSLSNRGKPRTLHTLDHKGVTSLAFSPDGKTLASGGIAKVKLWDVATGKELGNWPGHSGGVYSLLFAKDGKTLASWSLGPPPGEVRIWDVNKKVERANLGAVGLMKFTPDGKKMITARKLWDVATGEELASLQPTESASSIGVTPDGKVLLAIWNHEDHPVVKVKVWYASQDQHVGKELANLRHGGDIRFVAFTSDGTGLFTSTLSPGSVNSNGSDNHSQEIKLWDVGTQKAMMTFTAGHAMVFTSGPSFVAFNPVTKTIAAVPGLRFEQNGWFSLEYKSDKSLTKKIFLWNAATKQEFQVTCLICFEKTEKWPIGKDARKRNCKGIPILSSAWILVPTAKYWLRAALTECSSCGMWLQARILSPSRHILGRSTLWVSIRMEGFLSRVRTISLGSGMRVPARICSLSGDRPIRIRLICGEVPIR